MRKWLWLLLYVLLAGVTFIYRYELLAWTDLNPSIPLLIGIAALFALVPVIPYKFVIAAFGYSYGTTTAAWVCWVGTTLAALLVYAGARYVFRKQARAYLDRIRGLNRFTNWMEAHPFMGVMSLRLLPVVPQTAVNIYAGITYTPFWVFMAATAIGKMPAIFVFAYAGAQAETSIWLSLLILVGYLGFMSIVLLLFRFRSRKKV
ncbi:MULTISPECIES: TVP38/TMEM64 family protein [Paenibacillus]|uniref:TVP38/TMEM64 family membrane protein n=1 Tax=Paenibacillus xylanilyticus TaxID=248903 RepID=A0A7Y6BWH8_9BACL|nr:VTT domain-containing protein [Paenibacillus xylanilyticus]NUU75888.1 VTT domain-containing protein [Paenibacillus xylanilyticus]